MGIKQTPFLQATDLMPEVLDWQLGDPRLALARAVQELSAGKLVVLPTEAGYHLVASMLHLPALAGLAQVADPAESMLLVRSLQDALRFAPGMSDAARRLARRCWPGPLTLVVQSAGDPQVAGQEVVRMRMPAHEAILSTLDRQSEPLIAVPVGAGASTVDEMIATLGEAASLVIKEGPPAAALTISVVEVRGDTWSVTRPGSITAAMLEDLMKTTIMFVCTGNTCRSPLAEALCKKLLAERLGCTPADLPARGFQVISAGLAAMIGADASPEAVAVAHSFGADLSGHRSQPLTAELLTRADHLFAMTTSHLRTLQLFLPPEGPQPRLLAADGSDVPDPIGREPEVYRECAQLILRQLENCLQEVRPL